MSKEIENRLCEVCESEYKLVYDPNSTSGYAKHCPFCGEVYSEASPEDDLEYDDE